MQNLTLSETIILILAVLTIYPIVVAYFVSGIIDAVSNFTREVVLARKALSIACVCIFDSDDLVSIANRRTAQRILGDDFELVDMVHDSQIEGSYYHSTDSQTLEELIEQNQAPGDILEGVSLERLESLLSDICVADYPILEDMDLCAVEEEAIEEALESGNYDLVAPDGFEELRDFIDDNFDDLAMSEFCRELPSEDGSYSYFTIKIVDYVKFCQGEYTTNPALKERLLAVLKDCDRKEANINRACTRLDRYSDEEFTELLNRNKRDLKDLHDRYDSVEQAIAQFASIG